MKLAGGTKRRSGAGGKTLGPPTSEFSKPLAEKLESASGGKYVVICDAVSDPSDPRAIEAFPKAAYVIYDVHEGTIELRRLEYDIATAQKKILAAGLPERLAERLAYGR